MTDFPGRPDHPDFWLLSEVILDLDAQANAGQGDDIIARMVSPEAAAYVALQRGLRAETLMPGKRVSAQWMAVSWLDGFMIGMMFQQLKTARERPDEGNSPGEGNNPDET